jgi:cell division septum initiation protein DivIVA
MASVQAAANFWWNKFILGEHTDSSPTVPTHRVMAAVWPRLAPVMGLYANKIDPTAYWGRCRQIVIRLTQSKSVPDPMTNFPAFVAHLYKSRKVLRLETLQSALTYVTDFCPTPPGSFFLHNLVVAVANPTRLSSLMNHLEATGHRSWVAFMAEAGNVERVFDLFLFFLSPQTDFSEDQKWTFPINMGNLLSCLLFKYHQRLVLVRYLATTLFHRLLVLVQSAPESVSLVLLRCAMQIGDISLAFENRETVMKYFVQLFEKCAKRSSILRSMIVEWSRLLVDKFLPPRFFCGWLLRLPADRPRDVQLAKEVAITYGGASSVSVFQAFCRFMVQRTTWMRLYAQVVVEMVGYACNNPPMRNWFNHFLSRTAMFVCVSIWKSKYLRRVFTLLTILASNIFREESWVWTTIVTSAFTAFSGGMQFLGNFFEFGKGFREIDQTWIKEFKVFKSLVEDLKWLPFKAESSELAQLGDDEFDSTSLFAGAARIEIRALPVSNEVKDVLGFEAEQTKNESEQMIFKLQDMLEPPKKDDSILPIPSEICSECRFNYTAHFSVMTSADAEGEQLLAQANREWVEIIEEIIDVLKRNHHLAVDFDLLARYNTNETNSVMRRITQFRQRMREKVVALAADTKISDAFKSLTKLLSRQVAHIKEPLMFTRAMKVESIIEDVLDLFAQFEVSPEAVTDFFREHAVDSLQLAMQVLADEFGRLIGLENESYKQIVYNSLIRIYFSFAYTNDLARELVKYRNRDAEIAFRLAVLAQKPVAHLGLPAVMVPKEMDRVPIASFFENENLVGMGELQFIVNPIDMLHLLHKVVIALLNFCPQKRPNGEELQLMFIGLLARDPPVNPFGIYRFLETWDGLQLSAELDKSKAFYMGAIRLIMPKG